MRKRYIINLHAIHKASLIRETLPRHLTRPVPFFTDRVAKHLQCAAQLQVSGPAKRAEATSVKRFSA